MQLCFLRAVRKRSATRSHLLGTCVRVVCVCVCACECVYVYVYAYVLVFV